MKKTYIKFTCLLLVGLSFLACKKKSSSNDEEEDPQPTTETGRFVIATANAKWGAGQLTAWNGMPTGNVSNINGKSLQTTSIFGLRAYKNWVFDRINPSGDVGLQKYTVAEDLTINNAGFISKATQYVVVDENTGFYLDENRGLLKLQKFNPTNMQRTGELDFSSLKNDTVEYQVIGKHILAAKEGKLYASINYGKTATAGYGDDLFNEVEFAVIDIATGALDKTIKYSGIKGMGWGSSANKFYVKGDDDALYFFSMGFSMKMSNSSVIRIKKGETDFDKTFRINADDYQASSAIATVLVKGGKLYTQFSNTALKADYSNLGDYIFDYYVIDLATKQSTKIEGIPTCHFAHAHDQAIVEINGKIYFWVVTATEKAYYVLDGTKATRVFNVTDGGFISSLE